MTATGAFLWAVGAGVVINVLDYTALTDVPEIDRPKFSDGPHLVKFFAHPIVGGFLSVGIFSSVDAYNALFAMMVGAGAPNIWRSLVRAATPALRTFVKELGGVDADDDPA